MSDPYREGDEPQLDRVDVLICAGLDPTGGAGLIADVRVVTELGGRPTGIVTANTIQDTSGARWAKALDDDMIRAQLTALLSDIEVRGVKIGMLGSGAVARGIAGGLELTDAPVVWDPVAAPTFGDVAFDPDLLHDALRALLPHLTLLTPNAAELAELTRGPISELAQAVGAGRALAEVTRAAVLVKGGHLGSDESVDVLIHAGGVEHLRGPRIRDGEHVHGTGCALSSAIATYLARGADVVEACRAAKQFVAVRIARPVRPGRGAACVV